MAEVLLAVIHDTFLFLTGFVEGVELVLLAALVSVIVEQSLVEVLAEGVHLDVKLDHIGGIVCLERDNKNSLAVGLYKLCYVVIIALGVGFFE